MITRPDRERTRGELGNAGRDGSQSALALGRALACFVYLEYIPCEPDLACISSHYNTIPLAVLLKASKNLWRTRSCPGTSITLREVCKTRVLNEWAYKNTSIYLIFYVQHPNIFFHWCKTFYGFLINQLRKDRRLSRLAQTRTKQIPRRETRPLLHTKMKTTKIKEFSLIKWTAVIRFQHNYPKWWDQQSQPPK